MDPRKLVGLGGVLLAAMVAQINDQVFTTALADISGAFGLSRDAARWLRTVFVVGEVLGMCMAPSLGLIFSFRRFALFAVALSFLSTILMPLAGGAEGLFVLRTLQGLAAGLTIPLLMTVALQVLTPDIRLYGLAVYALTATFTPNLAAPLAALWTDVVDDWRFIFFEAAPLCAAAGAMIWFGVVQTPPQLDRLRRFDATGVLLVAIGFGGLAVVFEEGDWLDWFNSPLICVLTLSSAVAIPLFFVNETRVKIPLIRLELLKRRNFLYASITLIVFLVVALSASQVPLSFLEQVRGFRPLQAQGLTLMIAASQLVLLPATALLLDIPWLDSRLVSAVGLVCILTACLIAAAASSAWSVGQFVVSEALQSVGFSFVVMPLLMMATNAVKPEEGPYASALINTPRAVAEGLGVWVVDLIGRWRGGLHRVRILEILGQERLKVVQAEPVLGLNRPALSPNGTAAQPGALEALNQAVTQQASTLTTIDTFLIQAGLVLFLMVVLAVLPERTYPPRIALAKS